MAYYLREENKKKGIYLQMYESHWDKEKKQPRSKTLRECFFNKLCCNISNVSGY